MIDQEISDRNRKNRGRGKSFERRIAKKLGGHRTPLSGKNSLITGADVFSTKFPIHYFELKSRASHAIHSLFRDTEKKAKEEDKLPYVVTMEANKSLVLITMKLDRWLEEQEELEQMRLKILKERW